MNYQAIFEIGAAGMSLEKRRLDVAALNLANMHTTAASGTEPYRPLRVVAHAVHADFGAVMQAQALGQAEPASVQVLPTLAQERLVADAAHPHADAKGFVHYPGVDHATEMLTAMTALRAYEANLAAMGMARTMASRALEIGGNR